MNKFNSIRIAGVALLCIIAAPLLLHAAEPVIPASTITSDSAFVRAVARPGYPSTLQLDGSVQFTSDMGNISCDHLVVLAVEGANFSSNLKEEDIASMKAYGNVKFDVQLTTSSKEQVKDDGGQAYTRVTDKTSNYSGKGGAIVYNVVDGKGAFHFVDGAGITDAIARPEFHMEETSEITENGVKQPALYTKADYNADSFTYYPNSAKLQQKALNSTAELASKKIDIMQSSGRIEFIAVVDSMSKKGADIKQTLQRSKYEGHAPEIKVSYLLRTTNGVAYDRVVMLDNTADKLAATKPSAIITDITDIAVPRVIASMTANHIDVNLDSTEMNATGGVSIGYQNAPGKGK